MAIVVNGVERVPENEKTTSVKAVEYTLSDVAMSGSYNDLADKPEAAESGPITIADVDGLEQELADKQSAGDYALTSELEGLVTDGEMADALVGKQDAGDYATTAALISGLAGKQPVGDYLTAADLSNINQQISSLQQTLITNGAQIASLQRTLDELNISPEPVGVSNRETGVLSGWGSPTWRDEFSGTTIDTTKWNINDRSNYGSLSYDYGVIDKNNCFIRDNQLVQQTNILSTPVTSGGHTRYYSTAHMDTVGKFVASYGRWEMRAKLSTIPGNSRGVWPAWWMRNGNGQLGEIDIMEAWGDPSDRPTEQNIGTSSLTIHEKTTGTGTKKGWTIEKEATKKDGVVRPHSALDFHVWSLERTPDYLRCYFDGVMCIEMTKSAYPWAFSAADFSDPFHMRLNVQMGDGYWFPAPVPSNKTANTTEFVVDYVRYWAYQG